MNSILDSVLLLQTSATDSEPQKDKDGIYIYIYR